MAMTFHDLVAMVIFAARTKSEMMAEKVRQQIMAALETLRPGTWLRRALRVTRARRPLHPRWSNRNLACQSEGSIAKNER
jgi:hypothetical protein